MATLADQLAIQTRRAEEAEQRAEQAEQRAEEAEQRLLEEQARSEQHLLEEQARSEQRLLEEQARSEQRARADRALLDDARRAMQRYKNMAETQARHFRQQLDQALATIEDQGVEITALRIGVRNEDLEAVDKGVARIMRHRLELQTVNLSTQQFAFIDAV